MEFLYYPLGFVLLLGIVVTIHELGHFLVARWSGVHVLRFSVGFGRPLLVKKDRRGTDFTLAAVPLGGYVRMLDDRDPEQAELLAEMKREDPTVVSYMDLSPWWRNAIALAGPAANFVLAVLIFWVVALIGTPQPIPIIDGAPPESPLGEAGLAAPAEIVAVDGAETLQWQDVTLALGDRLGDTGVIELTFRDLASYELHTYALPIRDWHVGDVEPDFLSSLGMRRAGLSLIGQVVPGSAAERAGLEPGDLIVGVDGRPLRYWADWVEVIEASPRRLLLLDVRRAGAALTLQARPDARTTEEGAEQGYLGVGSLPMREIKHGLLSGFRVGVTDTWDMTVMTLGFLRKMIFGQVSVRNLVGPVGIAQIAGDTVRAGWLEFVTIMALMSVSVGIMNLLPIPLLDGGHVLFNTAEIVMRRPVPERVQVVGVQVGLALVGGLFILATYNDILRIF